jgi:hypothetical protein
VNARLFSGGEKAVKKQEGKEKDKEKGKKEKKILRAI